MIGLLVRGRVRIKIRVRVGVTFNVRVYHWSNCHRSKCILFKGSMTRLQALQISMAFLLLQLASDIKEERTTEFESVIVFSRVKQRLI